MVVVRGVSQTQKELNTEMFNDIAKLVVVKVSVCSVVSDIVNRQVSALVDGLWGVRAEYFTVRAQCAGVTNSYAVPEKMGADRWLASIAAASLYPRQELCIADCGSAINLEFVTAGGVHIGGYILPGLRLMQQALLKNTAKVSSAAIQADLQLGVDTQSSVANGCLLMAVAVLEKLQRKMQQKEGLLLLTGGDSAVLKSYIEGDNVIYLPELVLQGFAFIE